MTTRPEGRVVFLQMKLCRRKSEKRADRVVHPYKMLRIRKKSNDRHHQDRVRRCKIPNGQIVTQ